MLSELGTASATSARGGEKRLSPPREPRPEAKPSPDGVGGRNFRHGRDRPGNGQGTAEGRGDRTGDPNGGGKQERKGIHPEAAP